MKRLYWMKSVAAAITVAGLAVNLIAQAAPLARRPLNVTHHQSATVSGHPAMAVYGPITFVNANDGWVVGEEASQSGRSPKTILYRTRDGGAEWQPIVLRGDARGMGNIQFFSPLVGIGISDVTTTTKNHTLDHYVVLKTLDGGKTWTQVWHGTGPTASWDYGGSPSFFATPSIHAAGGMATITFSGLSLVSHNEGASWKKAMFAWTGFAPSDVTFSNEQDGFAIGTIPVHQVKAPSNPNPKAVVVARTSDGGLHWHRSYVIPAGVGNRYVDLRISFVNAKDGWFYEDNYRTMTGALYRTTDGGGHWKLIQHQLTAGRYAPGELSFVSPSVGWLPINSGAAPTAGGIAIMTDGGDTVHTYGANRAWSINSVSLVSKTDGWATGVTPGYNNRGYVLHTMDGGKRFTQVLPRLSPTSAISFVTNKLGYGYGTDSDPYAVLMSGDSGNSWRRIANLPQQTTFLGMDFRNSKVGWVAFDAEFATGPVTKRHPIHVWTTNDSGETWVKRVEYVDYPPYSSQTIPGLRLYSNESASLIAASFPIVVANTYDGGNKWASTSSSPTPRGETALSIASSHVVWWVNGSGDGVRVGKVSGSKVQTVGEVNLLQWPVGITFSNAQDGWFAADFSGSGNQTPMDAFATHDGGRTWTKYIFPNTMPYQPLAWQNGTAVMDSVGSKAVWILTGNGLLCSMDGGKTWTWV